MFKLSNLSKKNLFKKFVFLTACAPLICFGGNAFADVYVDGYYRSNGSYVSPHYRSSPDSSTSNNWSTYGNTNPYTGAMGYDRY